MICPNCKSSNFTQPKPKTFTCSDCGLKIKISENWSQIEVTMNGKTILFERDGEFETE